MTMRRFAEFKPGQRTISANELNRITNYTERHDRITGAAGMTVDNTSVGIAITNNTPARLMAKITSGPDANGKYGWSEVYWSNQLTPPGWTVLPDGSTDANLAIPAFEFNGASVGTGKVVELRLSPDQLSYNFLFAAGGTSVAGINGLVMTGGDATVNAFTTVQLTGANPQGWADPSGMFFKVPGNVTPCTICRVELVVKFGPWELSQGGTQASSDYGCRIAPSGFTTPVDFDMAGSCDNNFTSVPYNANIAVRPGNQLYFWAYHNAGGTPPGAKIISATIEQTTFVLATC